MDQRTPAPQPTPCALLARRAAKRGEPVEAMWIDTTCSPGRQTGQGSAGSSAVAGSEPLVFVDVPAGLPDSDNAMSGDETTRPKNVGGLERGEYNWPFPYAAYDDIILKPYDNRPRVVVHCMERSSKNIWVPGQPSLQGQFPFKKLGGAPVRVKGLYRVVSCVRDCLQRRNVGNELCVFGNFHSIAVVSAESVENYLRHRRRYLGCYACCLKRSGKCGLS